MPHSIRVFKALRANGFSEAQALCLAEVVEQAKTDHTRYDRERILDCLCDGGIREELAEPLCDSLRHCYPSQRFDGHYDKTQLKTALVRGKLSAVAAEAFLNALEAAIVTPLNAEIRQPVKHQPSPGRVIMCDFRYLRKPEMQKERRAIVVSGRTGNDTGRCAVVPVSKSPAKVADPHHYRIDPGKYPFFHRTEPVWAVCDHIYTVSLERLWMVNVSRRPMPNAQISTDDLRAIRAILGTVLVHDR